MALWGGRFTQAADQRFKQFNDSLRFDYRLAEQDIVGSVAWSKALVTVGVLTAEEQAQLEGALRLSSVSHPEYIGRVAKFFSDIGGRALLMHGTEIFVRKNNDGRSGFLVPEFDF